MSKCYLTNSLRETLTTLALRAVTCPAEGAALDAAYKVAAPLVRGMVEKKNPPRDMRVLDKYRKASRDACIKMQLTAGGVEQFEFAQKDAPLVANPTYSSPPYAADAVTTDAVVDWVTAKRTHKTALDKKLDDYRALIRASRSLEDVAAVWPEAEKARPAKSNALIVLSPEIVRRIEADVASRKRGGR